MINIFAVIYSEAQQKVDIGKEVEGFFGYTCIANLVGNAINVAFIVAAIATFVFMVVGGINWLTSGGDKGRIEIAQKTLSNALIGLAIVAVSYAIYIIVLDFFGIDLSKLCTDNPVGVS